MDGFLNVLKPRGVTSHDVVMVCRRLLREGRLGHLGTLDPLAVGVLPLACGTHRRLSEYFLGDDKRYFAEFTFGLSTKTGDTDGLLQGETDAHGITPEKVREALARLTGKILQTPPAYSALKVRGHKLLDLARQGIEVEIEPREVMVHEFKLVGWRPGSHPRGLFSITVGRGAYVRSLAMDLGDTLGCGAVVSYLLRERSGRFLLKDAMMISTLRRLARKGRAHEALCDPMSVMPNYRAFALLESSVHKVSHGVPVEIDDLEAPPGSGERELLDQGPFPFLALLSLPPGSQRPNAFLGRDIAAVVKVEGPREFIYDKVLIAE